MAASYLLSLREGLEAALIIGIVIGVLKKTVRLDLVPSAWYGAVSGIVTSILAAAALTWIGAEFNGPAEELFEGVTMFLAAGVLTWMVFWMHRQGRNIKAEVEDNVKMATKNGGKAAIFSLAFLAVVREGIELVLFLQAARAVTDQTQQITGATLGIGSAVFLGWLLFSGTRRLSLGRFFRVTNVLLALFAAGMVGLGIHEFNELGWIPAVLDPIWNLGSILPDSSGLGQLLKALVGYSSSPSLTQVIGYSGYMLLLGVIILARSKVIAVGELARR